MVSQRFHKWIYVFKSKWKNTNKKVVELCNRDEEKVCTKKEKSIFVVKKEKRRDTITNKLLTGCDTWTQLLQTQILGVGQVDKPCIRLT